LDKPAPGFTQELFPSQKWYSVFMWEQLKTQIMAPSLMPLPLKVSGIGLGAWPHNKAFTVVLYRIINLFLMLVRCKLL